MGMVETERYRTLSNGAIYDNETKRIVANKPELAVKDTRITKATSAEMQAKWQAMKRERIMSGANAVVAEGGKFDGTDLDFVEAIAEAQAIKALNPDDPKSTDAARFLLQEAGLSDKQQQEQRQDDMMAVIMRLADLAGQALAFDNSSYSNRADVIDGETVDSGAGAAGGGGDGESDGG